MELRKSKRLVGACKELKEKALVSGCYLLLLVLCKESKAD